MVMEEMLRALRNYLDKVTPEELDQDLRKAGAETWPEETFVTVKETMVSSREGRYSSKRVYRQENPFNKFDYSGEVA